MRRKTSRHFNHSLKAPRRSFVVPVDAVSLKLVPSPRCALVTGTRIDDCFDADLIGVASKVLSIGERSYGVRLNRTEGGQIAFRCSSSTAPQSTDETAYRVRMVRAMTPDDVAAVTRV